MISLKLINTNINTKLKICLCATNIYDILILFNVFPILFILKAWYHKNKNKQGKKITREKVVGMSWILR